MTPAIDRLAAHVLETDADALPPAALLATKTFLLDTIGVGVSGGTAPHVDQVLSVARGWGAGDEVSLFGRSERLPATSAAAVNGYQIHCQEFDCVHEPAVVHPLAVIGSALLAWAERETGRGERIDGRQLMTALALGVDIAASLGVACEGPTRFFRPANAGGFGAVAAIARLAGFGADRLKDAWGLQLGQTAGTMQAHLEGKPLLPLQIAVTSRAAITAIDMAKAGFPGPHDVFEGPFGYYPLFEPDWDLLPVLAALGKSWRIAEVSHKPYPTGRAAQAGISGILKLKADHGFTAEDVKAIRLYAPPLIHRLVGRPAIRGMQANYARLCMQYCGALALTREIVDVPDFRPEVLADPALFEIGQRIEVIIDGNPDPNALAPQRLEIDLQDGRALTLAIPATYGSPANAMTREAHLEKFRRNWTHAAEALDPIQGERLITMIDSLEQLPDIGQLFRLWVPQKG